MLCPNCEAENRDDAKFCDECGFPLSGSIARVAGSPSPAESAPLVQKDAGAASSERAPEDQLRPAVENPTISLEEIPPSNQPPSHDDVRQAAYARSGEACANGGRLQASPARVEGAVADAPRRQDDPFAGYSTSVDDEDLDFLDFPDFDVFDDAQDGQPNWTPSNQTMQMPRVDNGVKPASRDFRIAAPESGGMRKRVAIVIAAGVIAGVVIAAVVTFMLGLWGGVVVPDVTGMTESDARSALTADGFSVRSTQVKSDDTEGLVVIMDPEAGSRAGEGSEVVIHISTARFIPDVKGKSEDAARSLMEESGYENVRYEKEKSEGEEGIVLSVSPEAGTRAKSNAEIVVKVSEAYRVPDISGMDLATAEQAIIDSGLVPGVAYVDTEQYEDGAIIGTVPEVNTKVEKDSYVSISVARRRGAELVSLTESMLAPGQAVAIGGVEYEIQSVSDVTYEGDDVVSFTVSALPRTTFFGKTIYADEQVVSGQVAWSEDNEVLSIS